jgi:hypothetical protein
MNTTAVTTSHVAANPSAKVEPGDSSWPPLAGCAAFLARAACRTVPTQAVSAAAVIRPAAADNLNRGSTRGCCLRDCLRGWGAGGVRFFMCFSLSARA